MGMSRCYSLMKCLLILFNIIFLCVGGCACGFAAWALWDGRAGESAAGRAGLCALAAWAAVLALGAAAALAGAGRASASLLAAAVALLTLAAAAEATAAWWGAAHAPQLRRALHDELRHAVRADYGVLAARTHALDAIQQGLECCGADGARDWQSSAWARAQEAAEADADGERPPPRARTLDLSVGAPAAYYRVPASCCATEDAVECAVARRVAAASGSASGLHEAACGPLVLAALQAWSRGPLCVGAALLAAHVAALLLALALCLRARPAAHYKA